MRNLLSCDVVADYFLLQVDVLAGDTISNLKLQKLVYWQYFRLSKKARIFSFLLERTFFAILIDPDHKIDG